MITIAHHDALPLPVEIRRHHAARRLRLRYDERRAILKLTCPRRTSGGEALAWAASQREWVDRQIADTPSPLFLADGAVIPLEGEQVQLNWHPDHRRSPDRRGCEIICGGPPQAFARRIETFLKKRALEILSDETAEFAAKAGLSARSVTVGDARTRWGSCSAAGRIRNNWRLILAPVAARRFVVAHEVAHLAHLDHGPGFKELERRLYEGDVIEARALLRRVGPTLKRIVAQV